MVVAGSGGRVSSTFHHVPYVFNWRENPRILLARAVVVHHEEQVALQQPFVDLLCPAEKAHHLPVEEMTVA